MEKILSTRPKSSFKIQSELTYEGIQQAIHEKNTNRFLQGIVSTCKAHPESVVAVVYKAFSESVLLVFGKAPSAVIVEGSKVRKNLEESSEIDYLYVFIHSI